ncbi:MAG: histidine--tRNA ligase [Actinobacteria bacterium]|nr:histidine--tRNA ligase [Actinomycetota bacterium]
MSSKAPRGTVDLLPSAARTWRYLSQTAYEVFSTYGYEPIETPMFEQTDLFVHGIGEATDVVGKEMFSVLSKNAYEKIMAGEQLKADQRLSLRPEGTASVVRAVREHNLIPQGGAPVKLMYAGSMFRCERPQKGRLREFHQLGAECLGAIEPSADAELIVMLMRFFECCGLPRTSVTLLLNSMGDDACRPAYRESIRTYIHENSADLCEECNRRAETNPLRAFDCKNPACHAVMEKAPKISDALCDDCRTHYETVKKYLDIAGIDYVEDPRLVRGLDYYTHTVFEVQVKDGLGSQNAIGGGGRYDKLMEAVGGNPTPGLGFAIGFERTVMALEAAGVELDSGSNLEVYVATVDDTVRTEVFTVLQSLRDAGFSADCDHQARSLKSQLKLAGKAQVPCVLIVGPEELLSGEVTLRDMNTHIEQRIALHDVPAEVRSLLGTQTA